MKNIFPVILAASLCTACASMSTSKTVDSETEKVALQTKLFVSESGGCSLSPDIAATGQQEGLGTALAAALVPKLVNSGIDFLASALRKASGEDDKDLSVSSNETGAFLYKLGPAKLGAAVNVERRCIRAIIGEFPVENQTKGNLPTSPAISFDTLNSDAEMKTAISYWLGQTSSTSFNPHFYIEYELNPQLGRTFTIEPVLIWYPKEVFGDKYKLVSLELTAQNSPSTEKPAFQYTTVFNQKGGQSSGVRLGRSDLVGLQKRFFEGPSLSSARTSLQESYLKALASLDAQIALENNASRARDLAIMVAGKAALDCMTKAKSDKTAGGTTITDDEKLSCDGARQISLQTAENTFATVSDQLDALSSKKAAIGSALFAPDGAVNFTFKLTETTKPNKFLLALSEALTESKTEIQPAISRVFLGPQRSDQDRIDSFSDEWNYQTKLTAYSVAKAEYTALLEQVTPPATPEQISVAFETYRQTGKELGELAVKLGKPLPN